MKNTIDSMILQLMACYKISVLFTFLHLQLQFSFHLSMFSRDVVTITEILDITEESQVSLLERIDLVAQDICEMSDGDLKTLPPSFCTLFACAFSVSGWTYRGGLFLIGQRS